MQFARPPFEYPLGEYRKDRRKALDPKPALNPLAGAGCLFGMLGLVLAAPLVSAAVKVASQLNRPLEAPPEAAPVPPEALGGDQLIRTG